MSRTTWVRDTLIAAKCSDEDADRVMAEVRAEVLREAVATQRAALERGIPAEAPSAGGYLVSLIDPDAGQGEKDTAPAATSTPQLDERAARLYDHILGTGGDWSTGTAHLWVVANVDPNATRHRVRHALQHLAGLGYLIEHTQPGRVSYRPNYAKDGER